MVQKTSPFVEAKYGWDFGESYWNVGMDENLLKFSFLFNGGVDQIVATLPGVYSNGQAYYLTTDNRVYFVVEDSFKSTPVPKWFIIKDKSTGQEYRFNGTSLEQISTQEQLESDLEALETSLGTAAFESSATFALATELDAVKDSIIIPSAFGAVGDGITDDTAAFAALEADHQGVEVDLQGKSYAVSAIPSLNDYDYGTFVVAGQSHYQSKNVGYNLCWNGNFDLWQRGTSFTSFAARNGVADGWTYARTGFAAGTTITKQLGSRGTNNCMRVQRNSGDTDTSTMAVVFNFGRDDSLSIGRKGILSMRLRAGADFSGSSITVQVKGAEGASESSIVQPSGIYSTGDITVAPVAPVVGTDWVEVILPFTIPSTVSQIAVRLAVGPTGTAGAADYFEIEEVKLESGNVRTKFSSTPISQARIKAREQYNKSYNIDIQPGTINQDGCVRDFAQAAGSAGFRSYVQLSMRAAPTVTVYSPYTGASGQMSNGSTDVTCASTNVGQNGFCIAGGSATVAGVGYFIHWVAEAKL